MQNFLPWGKHSSSKMSVRRFLEEAIQPLTKDLCDDVIQILKNNGIKNVDHMARLSYDILNKTPLDSFQCSVLMKYIERHFNSQPKKDSTSVKDFDSHQESYKKLAEEKPGFEEYVRRDNQDVPNIHVSNNVKENRVIKVSVDDDSQALNGRRGTVDVEETYDPSKYAKEKDFEVFKNESKKHTNFGLMDYKERVVTNSAFTLTRLDENPKKDKYRSNTQVENSNSDTDEEQFQDCRQFSESVFDVKEPPDQKEEILLEIETKNIEKETKTDEESMVGQSEQSIYINKCLEIVLPTLSTKEHGQVLKVFEDLGVEQLQDFELVKESDLSTILKPIQVRKLLKYAKENEPIKETRRTPVSNNEDVKRKTKEQQLVADILKNKTGDEESNQRGLRHLDQRHEKMVPKPPPRPENKPNDINILILGETGVGKSTLINAFANYIKYSSLDDAKATDLICLIPTTFAVTGQDYVERHIKFGNDPNESGNPGSSQTQSCRDYDFNVGQTLIRLIDTPGVGDTSGIDRDTENFKRIIDHIKHFPHLNAVLILLKPNNARLNILFRFCIQELLNHLHKSASRNIVFLFTNARSTFFRPGDTLTALKDLLRENARHSPDFDIQLDKDTMYCVDNEAFRFLVALKEKVKFTANETRNFVTSWNKSSDECNRLVNYVMRLKPHKIDDTVALYEAKIMASLLTRPLCDVLMIIHRNRQEFDDMEKRIQVAKDDRIQLQTGSFIKYLNVKIDFLDEPITICTAAKCVNNASVHDTVLCQYTTTCYDPRHKTTLTEMASNPLHLECRTIGETKYCLSCNCRYEEHQEIYYENTVSIEKEELIKTEPEWSTADQEIQEIFNAMNVWRRKIDKEVKEQYYIMAVLAEMTFFLRVNAITVPTDPVMERIDHIINIESVKNSYRDYSYDVAMRIEYLNWLKRYYLRFLTDLRQKYVEQPERIFTPVIFKEQVENLFAMEVNGKYIEKAVQGQLRALEKKKETSGRETSL